MMRVPRTAQCTPGSYTRVTIAAPPRTGGRIPYTRRKIPVRVLAQRETPPHAGEALSNFLFLCTHPFSTHQRFSKPKRSIRRPSDERSNQRLSNMTHVYIFLPRILVPAERASYVRTSSRSGASVLSLHHTSGDTR